MTVGGAYATAENIESAAGKNIELIPTDLTGKDTEPVMGQFKMNKDGTKVLECPAGHKSKSYSYDKRNEQCTISLHVDLPLCETVQAEDLQEGGKKESLPKERPSCTDT